MDTGSECNVLPLNTYCRATRDRKMKKLHRCTHKYIMTYTGERYQILGSVTLPVWRRGKQTKLMFNITNDDFMPLLSLKTCTEMGLVTINDSDTSVNTVSDTPEVSVSSGYIDNPQPAPRSSLRKAVRRKESIYSLSLRMYSKVWASCLENITLSQTRVLHL